MQQFEHMYLNEQDNNSYKQRMTASRVNAEIESLKKNKLDKSELPVIVSEVDKLINIMDGVDVDVISSLDTTLKNSIGEGSLLKIDLENNIDLGNETKTNLENVIATANTTTYATKGDIDSVGEQLKDSTKEINIRKYNNEVKPLVSFMYDDGKVEDYTIIKPIFDAHNVPCSVCLITDKIGQSAYTNLTQLNEMKQAGWTIASHTAGHIELSTVDAATIELQCKNSQDTLKFLGFDYDIMVYPYGGVNDTVVKTVRKYYQYGVHVKLLTNKLNKVPYFNNMTIERSAILVR
jgi:peptidoglycan/xylan/chitin deacetylase (PgdA/CDA1 family)